MQPLEKTLRSKLEKTICGARKEAEEGARAVLIQLGIGEATYPKHLSRDEQDLRRRLRAHGRQLGDRRDARTEVQEIDRLAEEIAYEHWHRMLFARFLEANALLVNPEYGTPITLEECEEMAEHEGAANGWEVAARYAARMLPNVFRLDSPVFALSLPPEHQQTLEHLLADLPEEVFTASDSLGWVYQYWQAKRKEEVNKSEVKIGARELPAVTQLFTEPYMVAFLLDNSLGAWWATRRLTADDLRRAESETELREKASLPDVPLEYLRFVRGGDGVWAPAAGTFEAWPKRLRDLKVLDPCCGSGHFLMAALLMLVPMRMAEEGLTAREAVDAVLRENLHGLEIDPRCVELAAFALALTAWRYPGAGDYRPLPDLNVACSGLTIGATKSEWTALANGDGRLRQFLDHLYEIYRDAPALGSLLDPAYAAERGELFEPEWDRITAALHAMVEREREDLFGARENRSEMAVVAGRLGHAALIASQKYHLVTTNVPYLSRGKQEKQLADWCAKHFPEAKNDLATVFLERSLNYCVEGGTCSMVLPQNWLFLTTYRKLREKLLKQENWHLIARLGAQGFQTPMWDYNIQLLAISRGANADNVLRGLDVSEIRSADGKAADLPIAEIKEVEQEKQLENPDARVALEEGLSGMLLEKYAAGINGMHGADSLRFRFQYWEVNNQRDWSFFQCTYTETQFFGGLDHVFLWEQDGKIHRDNPKAYVKGEGIWGKPGVVISMMRELPATLYSGHKFDISCTPIIPVNPANLPAIWCFCSSPEYYEAVRQIDQALKVTNGTLVKVPFDHDYWTKVAEEKYPNGLPEPYTDDPTQWIFHGHPCGSVGWDEGEKCVVIQPPRVDASVLHVAVARLVGYRWPAELDAEMELADEARELVRQTEALLPLVDRDGIVCIPPVRGEAPAADRLLNLLVAAYGDAWKPDTLGKLLAEAGHAGKSLDSWLRDPFFLQHTKLFKDRPFVWHVWDGLRDGFAALVNYHRLDRKMLESLIYRYLGDWIDDQKRGRANGIDGAEERLAAAENLKKRMELILHGEKPYDIFVRWKPLDQQPVGWEPDLNDGVRLNIRPFVTAGVLRYSKKPQLNIHWNKDRGKDVESAPWYPVFKGNRINDHHLSLAEKQAARQNKS